MRGYFLKDGTVTALFLLFMLPHNRFMPPLYSQRSADASWLRKACGDAFFSLIGLPCKVRSSGDKPVKPP
jgi:hypothetical protein